MTIDKWYGGHAAVPRDIIFSYRNFFKSSGFKIEGVAWNKKLLLAEPPPFWTNANLYSNPSLANKLISAGKLLAVFFSSNIETGANWENLRLFSW